MNVPSRFLRGRLLSPLALLLVLSLSTPVKALDTTLDDLTIDQGDKGTLSLPRVEITGTNLTQDELGKLFAAATPEAERQALAARFQASKVTIPTALIKNKDGTFTLTGFSATGIDGGKVADASLAAITGDGKSDDGDPVTLKSGPITLKGARLLSLLKGETDGLTFSQFTLANLALTATDKETPATAPGGNLITLTIASIVGSGSFEGDVPTKAAVSIKGLTIVQPPASKALAELKKAGINSIDLSFDLATTYDIASQGYSIDELRITTGGLGALNLRAKLTGIPKEAVAGKIDERLGAAVQGKAASVEIIFDDAGLVEKLLAYYAAQQRKTPAALRMESAMMSRQMVPMMLGGAGNANAIAEQIGRFIENPKQLTIVLRPKNGPISGPDMMMLTSPPAFLQAIDVQVTAVTATAMAAPAAASPVTAAPAAASPAPAAPARLTGLEAWNALVGKTISGKNDDGLPFFEYYLPDGTLKQLDDTDISTGTWSIKKGQVCFDYSYSDEESCYSVVVDGTVATFTDTDGNGKRYEILQGNPKRL